MAGIATAVGTIFGGIALHSSAVKQAKPSAIVEMFEKSGATCTDEGFKAIKDDLTRNEARIDAAFFGQTGEAEGNKLEVPIDPNSWKYKDAEWEYTCALDNNGKVTVTKVEEKTDNVTGKETETTPKTIVAD